MTDQRQKLMAMLGTAVANLTHWEKISPAVQALGQRHAAYGVKRPTAAVGQALILRSKRDRRGFTPEVREAWLACYDAVSSEMLGGAKAS